MCASTFFLLLTLVFPAPWPAASSRKILLLLYVPLVVGLLCGLSTIAFPSQNNLVAIFALVQNLQAYPFMIAALVVLIVRVRRKPESLMSGDG